MATTYNESPPMLPPELDELGQVKKWRRTRRWLLIIFFVSTPGLIYAQDQGRTGNALLMLLALWSCGYVFVLSRRIHTAVAYKNGGMRGLGWRSNLRTLGLFFALFLFYPAVALISASPGDTKAVPSGVVVGILTCFLPFICTIPATVAAIRKYRKPSAPTSV